MTEHKSRQVRITPQISSSDKKQSTQLVSASKIGNYMTTVTNKARPSTGKLVAFGSVVDTKPHTKPMRQV